jgi:hypothetical protein
MLVAKMTIESLVCTLMTGSTPRMHVNTRATPPLIPECITYQVSDDEY